MTDLVKMSERILFGTTLGKSSPAEKRKWEKPRLRFNYRCVVCGCEFTGAAHQGYCCGEYAADVDEEREAQEAAE